jgi:hypothetical protein
MWYPFNSSKLEHHGVSQRRHRIVGQLHLVAEPRMNGQEDRNSERGSEELYVKDRDV